MDLTELKVSQFAKLLAGETPMPGGGCAAALAAALSASLCAMVGRLTAGREKYRQSREMMEKLISTADELALVFMKLVNDDANAYTGVMAAYQLPKGTEEEREFRSRSIEIAILRATRVPMATLENLGRLPVLLQQSLKYGNTNCLADAGVGVQLMRAAAVGVAYNIRTNVSGLTDQEEAGKLLARSTEHLSKIEHASSQLEQIIHHRLPINLKPLA
jgi:formiminotetrahydrofolate cyclodeaminase